MSTLRDPTSEQSGMDRRKFLFLAGAAAALGALVLAGTSRKIFQRLSGPPPLQGRSQAVAGQRIGTPGSPTGTSFLSRLFGWTR